MAGRRIQFAIARPVYGQIRFAQGKPSGVQADIIGLGRYLSEIEGVCNVIVSKPSLERTETILIELNRDPGHEVLFKRKIDTLLYRWAKEFLPDHADIIFQTATNSVIEKLDALAPKIAPEIEARTPSTSRDLIDRAAPGSKPVQIFRPDENEVAHVPPSSEGKKVELQFNNSASQQTKVSAASEISIPKLHADHINILLEALRLMSEIETGRLEALTEMAKAGRIPSSLKMKHEDRMRCILKADEFIRNAKLLLTGEKTPGKQVLDAMNAQNFAVRAAAIDHLRLHIQNNTTLALENLEQEGRGASRNRDTESLIMSEIDLAMNKAPNTRWSGSGLLNPVRYSRHDILRALESLDKSGEAQ